MTYRIRVRGLLPQDWGEWFEGFKISYEAGEDTTLTGSVVDQAALHGLHRCKVRQDDVSNAIGIEPNAHSNITECSSSPSNISPHK